MNTSKTLEMIEKLLDLPIPKIILSGEVNSDMRQYVYESMVYLMNRGSPDVEVIINSSGGDVKSGLDIYDALRMYSGKKKGIVSSKAESMAAVILQVCEDRHCCKHAHMLIHNGSCRINYDTLLNDDALEKFKEQNRKNLSNLHDILASRTGRQELEIIERCKQERAMTSAEALDFGLIDQII
jgi:ATP-dependent Clp protease, protease subunit